MACRGATDGSREIALLETFLSQTSQEYLDDSAAIESRLLELFRQGYSFTSETTCQYLLKKTWPALVSPEGDVLNTRVNINFRKYLDQIDLISNASKKKTTFQNRCGRSIVLSQLELSYLDSLFEAECWVGVNDLSPIRAEPEIRWPQLVTKTGTLVPIGQALTLESYLKIAFQTVLNQKQDKRI